MEQQGPGLTVTIRPSALNTLIKLVERLIYFWSVEVVTGSENDYTKV